MIRSSRSAASFAAAIALALVAMPATAQDTETGVSPLLTDTTQTARSHSIAAGSQATTLEGAACTGTYRVIGGGCHPGFSDQVRITNQFPNISANTWRCGFHNTSSTSRTVWVYTVCGRDPGPPLVTHNWAVSRFTTSTLNNADADRITADATTVAQVSDGPGDVACNIRMARTGNVTTFATGTGAINSGADFSAVIGLPGRVKVVNQINWCGGLIPNVIGCAPVPGNSFAVVRFTPALEGILWLHEFGHNKGLPHRNDANAVMAPSIASTRLHLNTTECNALRVTPMLDEPVAIMASAAVHDELPDIEEFVRQIYFHGVPFEDASQYGPDVIPILEQMLQDPAEMEYWGTIVVTIGMIGEPEGTEPLIDFITRTGGEELTREEYAARTAAVMSLGYIVNQSGDEQALDFLIEAARPGWWEGEAAPAPFHAAAEEAENDLATHAILGLALAATEEAIEALEALQEPADDEPRLREFQAAASGVIAEALSEAQRIREVGLEEYYEDHEH
jgi:hypothetical protein